MPDLLTHEEYQAIGNHLIFQLTLLSMDNFRRQNQATLSIQLIQQRVK